jgi:hypothetical protein
MQSFNIEEFNTILQFQFDIFIPKNISLSFSKNSLSFRNKEYFHDCFLVKMLSIYLNYIIYFKIEFLILQLSNKLVTYLQYQNYWNSIKSS